jgi:hypothetical protein
MSNSSTLHHSTSSLLSPTALYHLGDIVRFYNNNKSVTATSPSTLLSSLFELARELEQNVIISISQHFHNNSGSIASFDEDDIICNGLGDWESVLSTVFPPPPSTASLQQQENPDLLNIKTLILGSKNVVAAPNNNNNSNSVLLTKATRKHRKKVEALLQECEDHTNNNNNEEEEDSTISFLSSSSIEIAQSFRTFEHMIIILILSKLIVSSSSSSGGGKISVMKPTALLQQQQSSTSTRRVKEISDFVCVKLLHFISPESAEMLMKDPLQTFAIPISIFSNNNSNNSNNNNILVQQQQIKSIPKSWTDLLLQEQKNTNQAQQKQQEKERLIKWFQQSVPNSAQKLSTLQRFARMLVAKRRCKLLRKERTKKVLTLNNTNFKNQQQQIQTTTSLIRQILDRELRLAELQEYLENEPEKFKAEWKEWESKMKHFYMDECELDPTVWKLVAVKDETTNGGGGEMQPRYLDLRSGKLQAEHPHKAKIFQIKQRQMLAATRTREATIAKATNEVTEIEQRQIGVNGSLSMELAKLRRASL